MLGSSQTWKRNGSYLLNETWAKSFEGWGDEHNIEAERNPELCLPFWLYFTCKSDWALKLDREIPMSPATNFSPTRVAGLTVKPPYTLGCKTRCMTNSYNCLFYQLSILRIAYEKL